MDFDLSERQRACQEEFRKLGEAANVGLQRDDAEGVFSAEGWRVAASGGLPGLPLPTEYGGKGADLLTTAIALESFATTCRNQGLTFSICAHMQSCALPIAEVGTEEQRRRFLPRLGSGVWIGGNATTEPDSGSDVFAMRCKAVRDVDCYVLDGIKAFVTNAPVADVLLVYAVTNEQFRGFGGISAFLVEREIPGMVVGAGISKIGLRTSPSSTVEFKKCRVPITSRLGEEGSGSATFLRSMEWERLLVAATAVGRMHDTLERCTRFARTRKQFGRRIGSFQAVATKLVEMRADVDAARLLVYRAAWEKQHGRTADLETSLAKLFATEAYVRAGLAAIQIHGGIGCTTERGLELELRNAVPMTIASGTSQIQQSLIARRLGLI